MKEEDVLLEDYLDKASHELISIDLNEDEYIIETTNGQLKKIKK